MGHSSLMYDNQSGSEAEEILAIILCRSYINSQTVMYLNRKKKPAFPKSYAALDDKTFSRPTVLKLITVAIF